MIQQVTLISKSFKQLSKSEIQNNRLVVDCSKFIETSFTIEIEFKCKIASFRNHDYTWNDLKSNRIATEFSPKIIQLDNGYYVQPNITGGIWEICKKNTSKLFWHFNPAFSKPITQYRGSSNAKTIIQAHSILNFVAQPTLLFSNKHAVELSRSKYPFSAVACFTDHCDFDTLQNLKVQREFFKENKIVITKGFFLNHFSKRKDNASYENDKTEIDLWHKDGHELCYHSLSQSIKSDDESFTDFKNFIPPFSIPVWIDHGYQPYNFSLYQNRNFESSNYELLLKDKKIKILWNYIDSGTATNGVINQLNKNHFTLSSFLKGNKNLPKLTLFQGVLKTIVFHYLNDEKVIAKYKLTAQNFKKIVFQKQFKIIPKFVIDFVILFKSIFKVLFFWNTTKNKSFKLSKYTPLFFKHVLFKEEFIVFQTLEMIDFSRSLSEENVTLLIKERGIFIAHTYFSDSILYHNGKLLNQHHIIDDQVATNFSYLSKAIAEKSIWNPTLSELYCYLKQFESVIFDVNSDGVIGLKNSGNLLFRSIQ